LAEFAAQRAKLCAESKKRKFDFWAQYDNVMQLRQQHGLSDVVFASSVHPAALVAAADSSIPEDRESKHPLENIFLDIASDSIAESLASIADEIVDDVAGVTAGVDTDNNDTDNDTVHTHMASTPRVSSAMQQQHQQQHQQQQQQQQQTHAATVPTPALDDSASSLSIITGGGATDPAVQRALALAEKLPQLQKRLEARDASMSKQLRIIKNFAETNKVLLAKKKELRARERELVELSRGVIASSDAMFQQLVASPKKRPLAAPETGAQRRPLTPTGGQISRAATGYSDDSFESSEMDVSAHAASEVASDVPTESVADEDMGVESSGNGSDADTVVATEDLDASHARNEEIEEAIADSVDTEGESSVCDLVGQRAGASAASYASDSFVSEDTEEEVPPPASTTPAALQPPTAAGFALPDVLVTPPLSPAPSEGLDTDTSGVTELQDMLAQLTQRKEKFVKAIATTHKREQKAQLRSQIENVQHDIEVFSSLSRVKISLMFVCVYTGA
jgi:hypothetical protein